MLRTSFVRGRRFLEIILVFVQWILLFQSPVVFARVKYRWRIWRLRVDQRTWWVGNFRCYVCWFDRLTAVHEKHAFQDVTKIGSEICLQLIRYTSDTHEETMYQIFRWPVNGKISEFTTNSLNRLEFLISWCNENLKKIIFIHFA